MTRTESIFKRIWADEVPEELVAVIVKEPADKNTCGTPDTSPAVVHRFSVSEQEYIHEYIYTYVHRCRNIDT